MLDVQNHDGLLAFLFGMIVLVLAGVGLSMVADRVSDSGEVRSGNLVQIRQQKDEIQKLRLELMMKHSQLREFETSSAEHLEKAKLIELSKEVVRSRHQDLFLLKSILQASLSQAEESFQDYRVKARGLAWARAIGDSLGNLATKDGRMFQEAIVIGVDDKGISIRHSTGTASIPAAALAEAYWDIFQWERPEPMPRFTATDNPVLIPTAAEGSSRAKNQANTLEEEKEIAPLRAALKREGEITMRLAKELREISELEASSRSSSAPGSLDTWLERKTQLGNDLANAKMQYARARANLMIRSPHDPLLMKERIPWFF